MNDTNDRIANLSPVKRALLVIEELQARLDAVEGAQNEPIAVVGIGCRFPGGGHGVEAFWHVLREGVDAVREVPSERWDLARYYDPNPDAPGKMYTRWAALLDDVADFDPEFFGIAIAGSSLSAS